MTSVDQDYISKDDLFSLLASMKITLPRTSKMSTEDLSKRLREGFNASQRIGDLVPDDFLDPQTLSPWTDLEDLMMQTGVMQQSVKGNFERLMGQGVESPAGQSKEGTLKQMQNILLWLGLKFKEGMCDVFLSDRAISDWAVAIRILGVYITGDNVPVYILAYRHVASIPKKGLSEQLQEVLSQQAQGHPLEELARRAFLRLFKINAKKLVPRYVPPEDANKKFIKKKWKISFLLPLGPVPMMEVGKLANEAGCGTCGDTKHLRRCTQCMTVVYCSPECQKADWKNHKENCKLLKDGTWTTINFGVNPASPLADFPGAFMQMMNFNESWASASSRGAGPVDVVDILPNVYGDNIFLVKFQVGMGSGQPDHMLLYDRKRSFKAFWKRNEDAEAFRVAESAIGYDLKMYRWAKWFDDGKMSVCFDSAPSETPPW